MRLALLIAYDGTPFYGSAYQPQLRTVEGDVVTALANLEAVDRAEAGVVKLASRTDRGVSAAGNVCAVDSHMPVGSLLPGLVHSLNDIWVLGAAAVGSSFNPRHAAGKTYQYYLPGSELDTAAMQQAANVFLGQHNFSAFAKLEGRNPLRTITMAGVERRGGVTVVTFIGNSFLWNQVRRMVAAVAAVGHGEVTAAEVATVLAGKNNHDFGVASPEYLLLAKVHYEPLLAWQPVPSASHFLGQRVAGVSARALLFTDMQAMGTGAASK